MKKLVVVLCLMCFITQAFAQRRQADSLRVKQMLNNQKLIEDAKVKRAEEAKKNSDKGFVIESFDSRGNKVQTYKTNDGQKVTVTRNILPMAYNKPFNADTIDKDSISIRVIKSKFRHLKNL